MYKCVGEFRLHTCSTNRGAAVPYGQALGKHFAGLPHVLIGIPGLPSLLLTTISRLFHWAQPRRRSFLRRKLEVLKATVLNVGIQRKVGWIRMWRSSSARSGVQSQIVAAYIGSCQIWSCRIAGGSFHPRLNRLWTFINNELMCFDAWQFFVPSCSHFAFQIG